jgi:hypothetical protein
MQRGSLDQEPCAYPPAHVVLNARDRAAAVQCRLEPPRVGETLLAEHPLKTTVLLDPGECVVGDIGRLNGDLAAVGPRACW